MKKEKKRIINEQFYTNRNGDLAEALMEFGAVICKPSNPLCNICNLKTNCYFFRNKTSVLVNKKRLEKEKIRNIHVKAITGKYLTEKEWEIVQSLSEQSCDSDYPYDKEA